MKYTSKRPAFHRERSRTLYVFASFLLAGLVLLGGGASAALARTDVPPPAGPSLESWVPPAYVDVRATGQTGLKCTVNVANRSTLRDYQLLMAYNPDNGSDLFAIEIAEYTEGVFKPFLHIKYGDGSEFTKWYTAYTASAGWHNLRMEEPGQRHLDGLVRHHPTRLQPVLAYQHLQLLYPRSGGGFLRDAIPNRLGPGQPSW